MRPPQYRDMPHMNDGKPKPPFVGDGPPPPPHMAPRGGPPLPPRPMGPPMMGGREPPPPRRPAMAQSTYASGAEDEWAAPRPAPRRGGYNAVAPAPRAPRVSDHT